MPLPPPRHRRRFSRAPAELLAERVVDKVAGEAVGTIRVTVDVLPPHSDPAVGEEEVELVNWSLASLAAGRFAAR